MNLNNKKISILGMARSGIAAAVKTLDLGGSVFISESKPETAIRESFIQHHSQELWQTFYPLCEFDGHTEKVLDCDYLVVSPGIPLTIPIIQEALKKDIQVISEIEFGYLIKANDSKIIALTGSNGKSTTVSLIHHILKTAGYKSVLGGNIGQSFTSFPIEKEGIQYIVLELSSFQLELIDSFKADIAVLLNISPDHLDRYSSMNEYISAKMNIFKNQEKADYAILNANDDVIVEKSKLVKAKKHFFGMEKEKAGVDLDIYFDGEQIVCTGFNNDNKDVMLIDKASLSLFGLHNVYNTMAALLTLKNVHIPERLLREALRTFKALPHRLELISVINDVTFINDSKATNTDAVKYALSAFTAPLHLILGGYHKGEDYSVLNNLLKANCKAIYLIGDAAEIMLKDFHNLITDKDALPFYRCKSLADAVHRAYQNAGRGEIVLLSPACASYDMFKNYEHRGQVFIDQVHSIAKFAGKL